MPTLLAWYRKTARDLPWRRTRDPYRIWISETMLQQTRVAAVLPYYERFLEAFPTIRHLARASEEQVLALWSGLGYYTRARNLRRAAKEIVARHGGTIPADGDALESLPGIGRYTRGALLSLCFDRPHPVVDGNVERVLARWFAIEGDLRTAAARARLWALAGSLLPVAAPAAFNQAMMELGARVCTPRAPACRQCPIAPSCRAHAAGRVEELPAPRQRVKPRRIECAAAILESPRGVLLVRRGAGVNRGLYDLPAVESPSVRASERARLGHLRRELDGLASAPLRLERAGRIRHAVMEREYNVGLWRGRVSREGTRDRHEAHSGRWVPIGRLRSIPLTARARKALDRAGLLDSRGLRGAIHRAR